MGLSMIQFAYKAETVANLIKNPEDRAAVLKKHIEQLGGKMLGFYYAFGEYDGIVLADMPDNISLATSNLVAIAAGGVSKLHTTILMSVEEAMNAMRKAKGLKLPQPKG